MIVIRDTISHTFTKIDKRVFVKRGLSDGAKVLYGYLAGLPTGHDFRDSYIVKALGISDRTLANRKAELKKCNLILVSQLGPRNYILFIGTTQTPATAVKSNWERDNDF